MGLAQFMAGSPLRSGSGIEFGGFFDTKIVVYPKAAVDMEAAQGDPFDRYTTNPDEATVIIAKIDGSQRDNAKHQSDQGKQALEGFAAALEKQNQSKCYLTTACVRSRSLPDDCRELTTLRKFRDTYMLKAPGGPELVSQYYETAPQLVAWIDDRPDAQTIWASVYQQIQVAVTLVEQGQLAEAMEYYCQIARSLQQRYMGSRPL